MKSLLGAVVIENIGGGGGSVGAAQAARARADGYTLLLGGATTHITGAAQEPAAVRSAPGPSSLLKNLNSSAFVLRFSSSYKRSVRFGSECNRLVATLSP
jgi:tripartite-type tricarboxylate transporter receptor subunit TctC